MGPNESLIRRFVDAMNAHDIDAVAACYAPDARILYPGREAQSPADYIAGERAMLESVPNYAISIVSLLAAAGDHVLLELRMGGRQREDLGGREFSITGAYVFQIEGARIVEERAYPDIAGLRRQLSPRPGQ